MKSQRGKGQPAVLLSSLFLSLWPLLRGKRNPSASDSAGKQLSEEAYCRVFCFLFFFFPFKLFQTELSHGYTEQTNL